MFIIISLGTYATSVVPFKIWKANILQYFIEYLLQTCDGNCASTNQNISWLKYSSGLDILFLEFTFNTNKYIYV